MQVEPRVQVGRGWRGLLQTWGDDEASNHKPDLEGTHKDNLSPASGPAQDLHKLQAKVRHLPKPQEEPGAQPRMRVERILWQDLWPCRARFCVKSGAEHPRGSVLCPVSNWRLVPLPSQRGTSHSKGSSHSQGWKTSMGSHTEVLHRTHHLFHQEWSTHRWAAFSLSPPRASPCPALSPSLSSFFPSPPAAARGSA